MFPGFVLLDLGTMTHGAGIRSRDLHVGHIRFRIMSTAVAHGAADTGLTMFADLPIRNNIGRYVLVAIDTICRLELCHRT